MAYPSSIGTDAKRSVYKEQSYSLTQGFTKGAGTFYPNMPVKLAADGTVVPVAASTDKVLGYVASTYQDTDYGQVRVVVPFERQTLATSSGTVTTAQELACTGFDTTYGRPIYKTAASADYVSAIALGTGAVTTGLEINVGVLICPYLKP